MAVIPTSYNDEIDLLKLLETMWNGKWIILTSILIPFLIVFGFNKFFPNKNFQANSEIKPITSSENDQYTPYNYYIKNLKEIVEILFKARDFLKLHLNYF